MASQYCFEKGVSLLKKVGNLNSFVDEMNIIDTNSNYIALSAKTK